MPRSRIALWVVVAAFPLIGFANQDAAINSYLQPIISNIANDPNAGGWAWEANSNGGYLLRMEMDVNGDGQNEMFLTSSLTAVKRSAEWTVFDVDKSGTMRPYARTIELPADSVWPSGDQTSPSLIYVAAPSREREQASETAIFPVYRFAFAYPEIEKSLSYATEEAVTSLRPTDQDRLPKLQAILLADYLTGTNAAWSDVEEWKMDANDSFFRLEDHDRAATNTEFTPEAALKAINLRLQTDTYQSSAAQSAPIAQAMSSPARVPTATPQITKSPTSATEETKSSPGFQTVPVAIVVVVIVGIVLYILRRKSM